MLHIGKAHAAHYFTIAKVGAFIIVCNKTCFCPYNTLLHHFEFYKKAPADNFIISRTGYTVGAAFNAEHKFYIATAKLPAAYQTLPDVSRLSLAVLCIIYFKPGTF